MVMATMLRQNRSRTRAKGLFKAAMERADRNIDELLENLDGNFHRLRQSSIDEELFDVIAGYELLAKENPPERRAARR